MKVGDDDRQVDRTQERREKKKAGERAAEKDGEFKKLLDEKKDGKSKKKGAPDDAGADASSTRKDASSKEKQSSLEEPSKRTAQAADETERFDADRREARDTKKDFDRAESQTRVETGVREEKKDVSRVRSDRTEDDSQLEETRPELRTEEDSDDGGGGATGVGDADRRKDGESDRASIEGVTGRGEMAGEAGEVEETAGGSDVSRQEMQRIVGTVVEKIHVGEDIHKRQVVFVDVDIPGRGSVKIRVRKEGDGFTLRMRADNEELRRTLSSGRQQLREQAAEKGTNFSRIEVV